MRQKIIILFSLLLTSITFSACSTTSINVENNDKYILFKESITPKINTEYDVDYQYIYKSEESKQKLFNQFLESKNNLTTFLNNKPIITYIKNPKFIDDDIRINYNKPPINATATIEDLPLELILHKEYNFLPKKYRFSNNIIIMDISRHKDGLNVYILNKTKNTYILNDFKFIYNGFIYDKQIEQNLIPEKVKRIFIPILEKYTNNKLVEFNLKITHKIHKKEIFISEIIQK